MLLLILKDLGPEAWIYNKELILHGKNKDKENIERS